ncbi:type II toxin-antitoxin system ChpB family toxin [Paraburkholderia sp.]|uniref:type II toxin-antitoxin system ChpB family toxin n=1 Tax=Paraburkholderia sp. TaxID=1926495 RepID=UPI002F3EF177
MVRRPKFERGDIVRVSLNRTAGREQQGDVRPALVLSPAAFNALGMALVAPIAQGADYARFAGFAVPLAGSGTATQGVVLANLAGPLDLQAREAKRIERAPSVVVDEVLARLHTLLD